MARNPESFRGLSSSQIMSVLLEDEVSDRHTQARAAGARCVRCMDTGMNGGQFCSCTAGSALANQGYQR